MSEVPVIGQAVLCRVHTHRREPYSIRNLKISDSDRCEEIWHTSTIASRLTPEIPSDIAKGSSRMVQNYSHQSSPKLESDGRHVVEAADELARVLNPHIEADWNITTPDLI